MRALEALVEQSSQLKFRYENEVRPKYLEDEAERIFHAAFPAATLLRGSLWHDPLTNVEFENDLLIVLDSFLIVVECKSGGIAPSARRGGERLEKAILELIQNPAEQSARFADYLVKNAGDHSFNTKRKVKNRCNTSNSKHVIRLSLTFNFFGQIACQSRLLAQAGFLKTQVAPAVTMSLGDLETVFDILEGAHQKLHYLSRRSEWESHLDWHHEGHENTMYCIIGPEQRKKVIAAYAYKEIPRESRDAAIQNAFSKVARDFGCKDALLLGISADQKFIPTNLYLWLLI